MRILLVYAHPEPRSFNGQLKDLAVETLTAAGHEVRVSDLYAMRFDPVADRHDFTHDIEPGFFKLQAHQDVATRDRTFASDIAAEQEKIVWAELLIFQFPMWWQSVPAIMKGWFDRVLARGFSYGRGRAYDTAPLLGRRAICSLTTGSDEADFQPDGFFEYDITVIIKHVLHGTLQFVGFETLPPFVAWNAARVSDETRAEYLEQWRERLRAL